MGTRSRSLGALCTMEPSGATAQAGLLWGTPGHLAGGIRVCHHDPEFAQVQADAMKIAELQGRNIAVGIDL